MDPSTAEPERPPAPPPPPSADRVLRRHHPPEGSEGGTDQSALWRGRHSRCVLRLPQQLQKHRCQDGCQRRGRGPGPGGGELGATAVDAVLRAPVPGHSAECVKVPRCVDCAVAGDKSVCWWCTTCFCTRTLCRVCQSPQVCGLEWLRINHSLWDFGERDSSVVRAPDSWLKGHRFKSLQEQWENFLLQGHLSVLTLISVSVPPLCYCSST